MILIIVAARKHTNIPVSVGMAKAATVHFLLCVSFFNVMQVVEHGQCIMENSMVQTAVV